MCGRHGDFRQTAARRYVCATVISPAIRRQCTDFLDVLHEEMVSSRLGPPQIISPVQRSVSARYMAETGGSRTAERYGAAALIPGSE